MAFDFGNANAQQRESIQTTEGPLLIIAGPGTGKTFRGCASGCNASRREFYYAGQYADMAGY